MTTTTIEPQVEDEVDDGTSEQALEDKLFEVSAGTTEDGRVECEISDYQEVGDEIEVVAELPWGETFSERMPFPERDDSSEFRFVRLCERAGFSLTSVEQIRGATVEAEKEDGDWRLHTPEELTRAERFLELGTPVVVGGLVVVGVALLPITAAIGFAVDEDEPGDAFDSEVDMIFCWILLTVMWAFAWFLMFVGLASVGLF